LVELDVSLRNRDFERALSREFQELAKRKLGVKKVRVSSCFLNSTDTWIDR
jgi:hypothetical protein